MAPGVRGAVTVLLCASLIFTGTASATLATSAAHHESTQVSAPAASTSGPMSAAPAVVRSPTVFQTNNTTTVPQLRRPSRVEEDADTVALKRWLQGRMAQQLQQSSIQLSQGEYERAAQAVGPEYRDLIEQYVDIAAATDNASDDQVGQTLEQTRTQQRTFINQTERFNALYAELRAARAAGDEERARRLARRLNRVGTQAQQTSANLTSNYAQLETQTGANLSTATTTVATTTENVTDRRQQIVRELFVETQLTATTTAPNASFTNPLTVTGTLTVGGNASLPTVAQIQLGSATHTVNISSNGSFTFSYRPVTEPVGRHPLRVQYRPANASVYLPANDTITVTIENVTPSVTIATAPITVSYGEPVRIAGQATVNDDPVPRLPVRIHLAGIVLANTTTNASGRYTATISLPAAIQAGDQNLSVVAGNTTHAVTQTRRTQSVRVSETTVALSLTATPAQESIRVSGTLRTSRGTPVRNQPVVIRINGSTSETVVTTTNGTYQTSLALPADHNGTVTVHAVFDGNGTNLGDARATTNATTPPPSTAGLPGVIANSTLWILGVGGAGLVLIAVALYIRRRDGADTADDTAGPASGASTSPSGSATGHGEQVSLEERLEQITNTASTPEELTIGTFAALREAFTARADLPAGATHWEVYEAIVARDQTLADPMDDIVRAYEQAVYAPGSLSDAEAQRVVDSATTVATRQ